MKLRNKLNYSNVASSVALVIAVSGVGGAAYAAGVAKNSVGSPQIIDGQVKAADLATDAVRAPKIKNGTLGQNELTPNARKVFTAGPDAFFDDLNFHNISSGNADKTIFEFTVPAGAYYVTASANVTNNGADANDFVCELKQPIGEFTSTIATSEVRVAAGGGELGTISLDGIAVDTDVPLELTMTCEGQQAPYNGQVLDPRIVAVELGNAVNK